MDRGLVTPADARRRLLWHGVLLVLLASLAAAPMPLYTTPRLAVAAHLAGILDGILLMAVGLAWGDLLLKESLAVVTFRVAVFAAYAGWAPLVLGAWFGTSKSTPIAGAGHEGTPWQEALVFAGLGVFVIAFFAQCGLLLYGLRRR
jgi:hydroxylaminobenzene mutase